MNREDKIFREELYQKDLPGHKEAFKRLCVKLGLTQPRLHLRRSPARGLVGYACQGWFVHIIWHETITHVLESMVKALLSYSDNPQTFENFMRENEGFMFRLENDIFWNGELITGVDAIPPKLAAKYRSWGYHVPQELVDEWLAFYDSPQN